MKKIAFSVITATFLGGSALTAAPLVSVGDNVDIFLNLLTGVRSDSNVTAAPASELDDVIFTVRPGLEIDFVRGESRGDAQIVIQNTFLRYSDNDIYDADNLGIFADASFSDVVYEMGGNFTYVEDQSTTQRIDLEGLIESERTSLSGFFRYDFTEKVGVRVAADYTDYNYVGVFGDILQDRETFTLPVKFFYAYSPKLDLTAGFRYRNSDIDDLGGRIGNDPEDFQVTIGVEGELLPKLTGTVDLGWQNRDFQEGNLDERDTFTVAAGLVYAYSPKLTFLFNANRDFESVADGNPIESTSADVAVQYAYNQFWSSGAFLALSNDNFKTTGREDDTYTLGINGAYTPNGYLSLGGTIYYSEMDSNEPRDFDKTVVEFTASLRY